MRSYWNNPDVYNNKFKNGWYLSGDRASIDAEGYSGSLAAMMMLSTRAAIW